MLLTYAFKDCDKGVHIRFRTTGSVFNLRRFNTKTKNFSSLIRELLYADDADFVSHSEEDLQEIMNLFSTAFDAFGLTISIKKTKVMFTPVYLVLPTLNQTSLLRKRGLRLWTPLCI